MRKKQTGHFLPKLGFTHVRDKAAASHDLDEWEPIKTSSVYKSTLDLDQWMFK